MIITFIKILIMFPFLVSGITYLVTKSSKKSKKIASFFYAFALWYLLEYLFSNKFLIFLIFLCFLLFVLYETIKYVKRRYRSYIGTYIISNYLVKFSNYGLKVYFGLILICVIKTYLQLI